MDLEEYLQLLESPTSVDASHVEALQNMLQYAPYCASARLLLLKAMYASGDKRYAAEMERGILSAPPETSVYFLLNPKKIVRKPAAKLQTAAPRDDTYFALIEHMQEVAQRAGISFEELAKRYMDARQYIAKG